MPGLAEHPPEGSAPKWDSLAHINLIVAPESSFDVTLEVEDFAALISVPAITDYLKNRGIE